MAFKTKITRARLHLSPFSSEQMAQIGSIMADTISTRIRSGKNGLDNASKALAPNYAIRKKRKGLAERRDWTWRGKTLRALKVKRANENRVEIGFIDAESDMIAHVNNNRERAFTTSPEDNKVLVAAVRATIKQHKVVRVVRQSSAA